MTKEAFNVSASVRLTNGYTFDNGQAGNLGVLTAIGTPALCTNTWSIGMARRLRIQYLGAIYQVMNRGDLAENIFRDDVDRTRFLGTLAEWCEKTAWQVRAETTVTVGWLAQRLHMGTRGHLAHLLYRTKGVPGAPTQPTLGM